MKDLEIDVLSVTPVHRRNIPLDSTANNPEALQEAELGLRVRSSFERGPGSGIGKNLRGLVSSVCVPLAGFGASIVAAIGVSHVLGCSPDSGRSRFDNQPGIHGPSVSGGKKARVAGSSGSESPQQFGTIEGGLGLDDIKVPKLELDPVWPEGVEKIAGRFEVDGKNGTIVVVYDQESEKDVLEYKLDGEETVYPVKIEGASGEFDIMSCLGNTVYIDIQGLPGKIGMGKGILKFNENNKLIITDLETSFELATVEMKLQEVSGIQYLYSKTGTAVGRTNVATGITENVYGPFSLYDQFTLGIPVQLVPGSDENPAGVWIVPKIDKESGITSFVITDYDPSEKDADGEYNVLSEQVVSAFNNISVDGIEHIASVDDVVKIQELSNGGVEIIFIAELFGPYKFGKYVVRAEISGLTKIVEQPEPQPEASDKDVGEYPDADAGSNVEVIELDSSDIEEVTGEDGDADAGSTGDGDTADAGGTEDADAGGTGDGDADADGTGDGDAVLSDLTIPKETSDTEEPKDESLGDLDKPDGPENPGDLDDLADAEDGSDATDAGGQECSTAPEDLPEHFTTTMNDCEIEVCRNVDGTFDVTMTGAPKDIEKCGINIGKTSVSAGNDTTKSLNPDISDGKIKVSFKVSMKTGPSEQPVEADIAGVQTGIDDLVRVVGANTVDGSVQNGDYIFQADGVNISLVDSGINEKGYRVVHVKAENMGTGTNGFVFIKGTRGGGFEIVVFVDGAWHPYVINEYGEFKEMPCSQADDPNCGSPDIGPQQVDSSSGSDTVSGADITGIQNGGEPGCSAGTSKETGSPLGTLGGSLLALAFVAFVINRIRRGGLSDRSESESTSDPVKSRKGYFGNLVNRVLSTLGVSSK